MTIDEWTEKYLSAFKGLTHDIDPNAPDGAWIQMHIDWIEWGLERWSELLIYDAPPEDIDAYDIFYALIGGANDDETK